MEKLLSRARQGPFTLYGHYNGFGSAEPLFGGHVDIWRSAIYTILPDVIHTNIVARS